MIKEDKRVLNELEISRPLHRLAGALFDFAIFVISAFVLMFVSTGIFTQKGTTYYKNNELQGTQIENSYLAKEKDNGFTSYTEDEYFTKEDDGYLLINHLYKYYSDYLVNYSLDKDQLVDGQTRSEYYTVSWFNENILKVGNEYFTYSLDNDNNPDLTKVGTLKAEFISGEEVVKDAGLYKYSKDIYQKAIEDFYNQTFIKKAVNENSLINSFVGFSAAMVALIVFYLIIPLFSKYGQTLGKHIMKIYVVNSNGFLVKKYQTILRAIPLIVGVTIFCFVKNFFIVIIGIAVLFIASVLLMILTRYHQSLHDYLAFTVVIKNDGSEIYKNKVEYEKAKEIELERNIIEHEQRQ